MHKGASRSDAYKLHRGLKEYQHTLYPDKTLVPVANSRHRDLRYSVSSLDGQPILRRDAIAAPPARRAAKPAPKRIPLSAPVFARGDLGFFGLSGVLGGTAGGFDSEGAGGTEAVVDVEGLGAVEVDGEGVGVVLTAGVGVVVDGVGTGVVVDGVGAGVVVEGVGTGVVVDGVGTGVVVLGVGTGVVVDGVGDGVGIVVEGVGEGVGVVVDGVGEGVGFGLVTFVTVAV